MGRIAPLRDDASVRPLRAVRVQLLLAVCFVIVLALTAVEARVALGTDANTLALLDERDFRPDTDSLPNNLFPSVSHISLARKRDGPDTVSNGEGEMLWAPTTTDGVYVAATNAAALNLDVDIVVPKGLGLEFILVKVGPGLGPVDLEARELVGIGHFVVARGESR